MSPTPTWPSIYRCLFTGHTCLNSMFVMGSKSVEDEIGSSYDSASAYDSASYADYLNSKKKEDLSNKDKNTTDKNGTISKRESKLSSQELREYTLQVKGILIIVM